ncbi:MAG: SprT-like domain-containing protein [Bacteroidia bacterium]|nr:SprT-like domain-containing protein [Bacteroidia bacterium]MCZ2247624.1 SprT-like domain-containing protein [Bacteroidia bacterium]
MKKRLSETELIEHYKSVLLKFLPPKSTHIIATWILHYNFDLKITHNRQTKLGDYKSPYNGKRHKISINHNLNTYAFLITLVHEIAHLTAFEKYGHKIKPHGAEWKQEYKKLMLPFINDEILPVDIQQALNNYLINPAAASCTDEVLLRTLKRYDKPNETLVYLEDIPEKSIFKIAPNRIFEKGEKLRKRYKCQELDTKRIYLFSPLAEVKLVQKGLF